MKEILTALMIWLGANTSFDTNHDIPNVLFLTQSQMETLYYPEKYAGTADLICKYQGQDVLVDFKQSNRPKKSDYIQDYFLQLGAYTLAHDVVHGTKMKAGIILLCTVDNLFQEFKIEGAELEMYQNLFLGRVKKFYKINNIT